MERDRDAARDEARGAGGLGHRRAREGDARRGCAVTAASTKRWRCSGETRRGRRFTIQASLTLLGLPLGRNLDAAAARAGLRRGAAQLDRHRTRNSPRLHRFPGVFERAYESARGCQTGSAAGKVPRPQSSGDATWNSDGAILELLQQGWLTIFPLGVLSVIVFTIAFERPGATAGSRRRRAT